MCSIRLAHLKRWRLQMNGSKRDSDNQMLDSPSLGGDHAKRTGSEPALAVELMLPRLLEALDAPDWATRQRAIEGLGRTRDPRALPPLLDALHSTDKHT